MHAIIIGSGLVGATTAIALHQVGIKSTLYDQVDLVKAALSAGGGPVAVEFGDSGGSVLITASALRVLKTLGLLREVLEASHPTPTSNWYRINGSSPITLDVVNSIKFGGEADPELQLHSILMTACHKAEVRTFTGKKLVMVAETENGVRAEFADGTTASGDFLVGADGIHSATRRAIFGAACKAEFTGVIGHIGVVKLKENNIALKETCAFYVERNKKQLVCTFKMSEELGAVQVMTFNDPPPMEGQDYRPHPDLPKESARLADLLGTWGVPKNIEQMMRKSFRISPAALYDLPDIPSYHKGRVVLLGDSAHGMVPNAGLGLLTGLEDVGVLLELFRHYQQPGDISRVFSLYSQLRVPRGHDAAGKSRQMAAQFYGGSSALGHFMLRVYFFLVNHNLGPVHTIYDCPTEVKKAIKELECI
ncbi:hypothetical protein HDU79_001771 [Rhizoclosmatium sp. JEL0117]|nr:hypothetical protein HDU79_001765 [Rhizoclosmatium sp. JEL0117]KAJ3292076.1 hypothetical protein HDU79_001771 [Rhizoclosmatium sp. JEL0117]